LIALDSHGKVVPYLASSWKVTLNSVTFTIRRGVTCADGTPVTPTVVANSLRRLFSPEITKASPEVDWGSFYFGAGGTSSVSRDDAAGTVTFTQSARNSELLYSFLWPQVGIVCPAGLDVRAGEGNRSYGSGPYILESRSQTQAVLRRRPDWNWGLSGRTNSDPGVPDILTLKTVLNETTAANLLLTGGLDLARVIGTDVERLLADRSVTHASAFSFSAEYLIFNEDPNHPTGDEKVREAIMVAVDPAGYNQAALGGRGRSASGLFMPGTRCYSSGTAALMPSSPGDVNKARSMLLAYGYQLSADGRLQRSGKPLTLMVVGNTTQNSGPEYIADQLTKMGATVTLRVLDRKTSLDTVVRGDYDVAPIDQGFAVPTPGLTPNDWNGVLPPTPGNNLSRTTDSVLIGLMEKGRSGLDCFPWVQWQRRILEKHHALPLPALQYLYFGRGLEPVTIFGLHLDPTSIRRK